MYAEERQRAIATLVTERGRVSVNELADRFSVTTETVRRDLTSLEQLRLIRRVHGGALPVNTLTLLETGLSDRDLANTEQKSQIAEAALRYLPDQDATILLDAGSTTSRLAEVLPHDRRLNVFTHAVPIAARLAEVPSVELHLLPGRVRRKTQAAVGIDTVAAIDRLRADVGFFGANGISVRHGLSTPDPEEADTKAALIAAAELVVVLCDSSKIGEERTVRFARLADIDVLITDSDISGAQLRALKSSGVEVVVA